MKKITIASIVAATLLSSTLNAEDLIKKATDARLKPIPAKQEELLKITDPKGELTPQKIELGKKLYFDPRLSKSNHNGQIWTLEEAVKEMGSVQLGLEINDTEATSIATFLKVLTGEKPQIIYPMLPDSTQETPKPDAQ